MRVRIIAGMVILFSSSLLAAGCDPGLQADNPFDPATPANNQAPAKVEGTVFARSAEGADPRPLQSAHLSLLRTDRTEPLTYDTAAAGTFAFEDLQPGTYLLDVSHASHLSQAREFELGPGETRSLPILLDPIPTVVGAEAGALTGVVLLEGEQSKPAGVQDHSGILVEVVGESLRTTTAKDGRFDLILAPGDYTLRISARNHADHLTADPLSVSADTVTELSTAASPLVLLALPGAILGSVVLENVDPAEPTYPVDLPGAGVNVALLGANDGPTAADGTYRVTAPAGTYVLAVSRPGWVTDETRVVTIEGGVDLSLPPIRLRASRGSVAGRVILEGRADHAGALASLSGTTFAATSTPTGEFEIREVPVGTYELMVQRDGYRTRTLGSVTISEGLATPVGDIDLFQQVGAFAINAGAEFTNDPVVTLSLGNQNAVAMRISHDSSFTDPALGDTAFGPFAQTPSFTLVGSDGTKTVYVQYQDAAGSSGPVFSSSIVLDTTPPQSVGLVIDQGSPYTNDAGAIVSLQLPAVDDAAPGADRSSGVDAMRISNDPAFAGASFVPYELSRVWTLATPGSDGSKTVYVEYRDRAGNVSAPASDGIVLDRQAPTLVAGTFQIAGGAAYTRRASVVLTLSSPDATRMAFSQDAGFPVKVYEPYADARIYDLLPGDGPKSVHLLLMDEAGNEAGPFQANITLDTTEPGAVTLTLTGTIAGGLPSSSLTGSRTVDLTIGASDASGLDRMWIANDAGLVGATQEPFATSKPGWTLPAGAADGPIAVYLIVSDLAGNTGRTTATIVLDTTPPELPSLTITQGAYTTSPTVDLRLGAVGATQMFISGQVAAAANTNTWIPYQTGQQVPLVASPEGARSVTVRYRDAAGNEAAAVSAATVLDTQAPTSPGITLQGIVADGATSASLTGRLGITAYPTATGATEVMLSNDASFSGGVWLAYSPGLAVPWNLLPGDGAGKVVWARFRDAAGNLTSTQSLPIELDTTPPGSAAIVAGSGEAYTGSTSITVRPSATGAWQMRLSTDGVFDGTLNGGSAAAWESWAPYGNSATVSLPPPDGTKTVYAVFRDQAGNESPAATDAIELDTTLPTSPELRIDENALGFVSTVAVTVRARVDPGNNERAEMQMRLSTDGVLDSEPWVAYAETAVVLLPGGDCATAAPGCKEVCAEYRDPAGNTTSQACDTTTLDGTPPTTPSLVTPTETVNTSSSSYVLAIAAPVDDDFFDHYEVVVAAPDGATQSYSFPDPGLSQTNFPVNITQGGSAYDAAARNTLRITGVDRAGNRSSDAVAVVIEDSGVPVAPTLVGLTDAVVNADTLLVTLDRADSASRDATFSHFETAVSTIAGCPPTGPDWAATSSTRSFTFQLRQGNGVDCSAAVPCSQQLCVKAVDAAGNEGPPTFVSLQEDSIPPTTPSASPRRSTVNAPSVDVRLDTLSSDDTAITYEVLGGQYSTYTTSPTQAYFSFDLAQDQVSDFCIRARDEADNLSVPDCVEITEKSTARVTSTDYHEVPAAMQGDWVLYERHQVTAPDDPSWIYLKNIATDEEIYIGWGSRARMAVTATDFWFVWDNDTQSVDGDVYVQARSFSDPSVTTTSTRNVTQWHTGDASYADTDGRWLTFYSYVGVHNVYRFALANLSTLDAGTSASYITEVSGSEVVQRGPTRVSSSSLTMRVFYIAYTAPNYQIYRYFNSAFTGTTREIITNNRSGGWDSNSRFIVWTELVGGENQLFWLPISAAPNTRTATGAAVTGIGGIWSPPATTGYGYTFDAMVVVTRTPGNGSSSELYLYKIGATDPGPTRLTDSPAPKSVPALSNGGRILFPAFSAMAADLYVMDLSETRWITADPGDQYFPKIDGDLVIWGDARLGAADLGVHDLSTKTETLITSFEGAPQSLGGAFVGYSDVGIPTNIRLLDISNPASPVQTLVSTSGVGPTAVALGGSRVAWTQFNANTYAIYRSDLPPPISTVPETSFGARLWPDVQFDTVVWSQVNDGFRIYCKNIGTGQTAVLDTGFYADLGPAVTGSPNVDLVWRDDINVANADLRYCHLTCATTPTCNQIVLEPVGSAPASFSIADGLIAWRRESPQGSANVKVFDQSVGAPFTLSPFVARTSTQSEPETQGGRVVFEDDRSGNRDIYLWTAYR
ncbi:MAG: carboxypeptidase regulatory-like domain-containing protein [Deltaproteobacteria bacterium]|nr:carboxypeptidase regulatory-like domain-containing protein [Deltaproteobacteria bacterium]